LSKFSETGTNFRKIWTKVDKWSWLLLVAYISISFSNNIIPCFIFFSSTKYQTGRARKYHDHLTCWELIDSKTELKSRILRTFQKWLNSPLLFQTLLQPNFIKNIPETIELTFIIPNTASAQLFFNGFLDLLGLHSNMKSTPQILPLWFRWLTHYVMQKESWAKKKTFEVSSVIKHCC